MPTFELCATVLNGKEQEFHYRGVHGEECVFSAHPTEAWRWMGGANTKGQPYLTKLIEAFVAAGLNRGDRSFEEAIKTLYVE